MIDKLKRGVEILRKKGPRALLRNTRDYLQRVEVDQTGLSISYQNGSRIDFEDRLQLLQNEVDNNHTSLMDIGCAEGDFTARFADQGMISIGIERQQHTVVHARKRHAGQSGLGFLKFEITPDTVNDLPRTDVVLLLTVYHHWISEFGDVKAEEMLRTLVNSSEILFFEVPNRNFVSETTSNRSAVDFFEQYLEQIGEDVEVTFLGQTEYKGEDREDIIFVLQ